MQLQYRTAIFNNIPPNDYLGIFDEKNNPSKKVVDFLQLTKDDVSKATRIPKTSIRYDERMPEELAQRLQEIGIICDWVAEYFKGDLRKTTLWFQIKNPLLGNLSPRDMIRLGRYQKLVKYVYNAFAGNTP